MYVFLGGEICKISFAFLTSHYTAQCSMATAQISKFTLASKKQQFL